MDYVPINLFREHVVHFISSWDKTGKIQQFAYQYGGGYEKDTLIVNWGWDKEIWIISATLRGGLKNEKPDKQLHSESHGDKENDERRQNNTALLILLDNYEHVNWLIVYCFMPHSKIFQSNRNHCHCRRKNLKFRLSLGTYGHWAGRYLYRDMPAMTRDLYILGLTRKYNPLDAYFGQLSQRQWKPTLTRISTGFTVLCCFM